MARKKTIKTYPIIHRVFEHGWYDCFIDNMGKTFIMGGTSYGTKHTATVGYGIVNKGYIALLTGTDEDGGMVLIPSKKCTAKYHDYQMSGWGIRIQ